MRATAWMALQGVQLRKAFLLGRCCRPRLTQAPKVLEATGAKGPWQERGAEQDVSHVLPILLFFCDVLQSKASERTRAGSWTQPPQLAAFAAEARKTSALRTTSPILLLPHPTKRYFETVWGGITLAVFEETDSLGSIALTPSKVKHT